MPSLADAGLQLFFNGPEAFTPDGTFYLGEAPEVDRCFVAAGFNSVGIQTAGGAGWFLADWIVDGHPPMDLSGVDIRRSFPFQNDRTYLKDRISSRWGFSTQCTGRSVQYESARNIRKSAPHEALAAQGAVLVRPPDGNAQIGSPTTTKFLNMSTPTENKTGMRICALNVTPYETT